MFVEVVVRIHGGEYVADEAICVIVVVWKYQHYPQ